MFCEHHKTELVLSARGVELRRCRDCELIFSIKRNFKPAEVYEKYYKERTGGRFDFGLEHAIKLFRFWRAVKIFAKKSEAEKILDIGSGRGWTLYFLKKYFGFKTVSGIQISPNACIFSKEKLGLDIYNQDFLELDFSEKFDVITLWHVLEHLEDPQKYLDKISQSVAPGGLLMIEVPNFNSWSRIFSPKHWLALDPEHHITFLRQIL